MLGNERPAGEGLGTYSIAASHSTCIDAMIIVNFEGTKQTTLQLQLVQHFIMI